MGLITLQLYAVGGEVVEILHVGVKDELGGVEGLLGQHLLHHGDMAVVDVAVSDDVNQLAGLKTGGLGDHVQQGGVLHHVPAVGGEHILRALVQNGVQGVAADVEGHGVGAGIQGHLVEVVVVVHMGDDAAGSGVVLQIPEHLVHLIHIPLGIVVLDAQLIAVGLADGTVLVGPGIPDVAAQLSNTVGLLLPDPQQLVHGGLDELLADGHDGELLPQVIAVDHAKQLHGVGGLAVLPAGANFPVGVPDALGQDVFAVLDKNFIGTAHARSSCISSRGRSSARGLSIVHTG